MYRLEKGRVQEGAVSVEARGGGGGGGGGGDVRRCVVCDEIEFITRHIESECKSATFGLFSGAPLEGSKRLKPQLD
jgi:hypothetical protein